MLYNKNGLVWLTHKLTYLIIKVNRYTPVGEHWL